MIGCGMSGTATARPTWRHHTVTTVPVYTKFENNMNRSQRAFKTAAFAPIRIPWNDAKKPESRSVRS